MTDGSLSMKSTLPVSFSERLEFCVIQHTLITATLPIVCIFDSFYHHPRNQRETILCKSVNSVANNLSPHGLWII
jgi:hypothetical protein